MKDLKNSFGAERFFDIMGGMDEWGRWLSRDDHAEFGRNHFVVGNFFGRLPWVAQKQQPRALMHNLFEIEGVVRQFIESAVPEAGVPMASRCTRDWDLLFFPSDMRGGFE